MLHPGSPGGGRVPWRVFGGGEFGSRRPLQRMMWVHQCRPAMPPAPSGLVSGTLVTTMHFVTAATLPGNCVSLFWFPLCIFRGIFLHLTPPRDGLDTAVWCQAVGSPWLAAGSPPSCSLTPFPQQNGGRKYLENYPGLRQGQGGTHQSLSWAKQTRLGEN